MQKGGHKTSNCAKEVTERSSNTTKIRIMMAKIRLGQPTPGQKLKQYENVLSSFFIFNIRECHGQLTCTSTNFMGQPV